MLSEDGEVIHTTLTHKLCRHRFRIAILVRPGEMLAQKAFPVKCPGCNTVGKEEDYWYDHDSMGR